MGFLVPCKYHEKGCKNKIKLDSYSHHIENCKYGNETEPITMVFLKLKNFCF